MKVHNLTLVFDAYYDRLVFFCFKLLNDKEQAKDITQEAFLKYWQRADEVADNEIAIKNFLYSTVQHAALNVVRHAKVVDAHAERTGKAEPQEGSVMEAMITAEVLTEIHAAIELLPEQYRRISKMGYFEGKKNNEIAEELGMSVNTVKKQKQKALELLRLRLRPELFALFLLLFEN